MEVLLGLASHALSLSGLGRLHHLLLLEESRQFHAGDDALRVLRLLLRNALLHVLRVERLQKVSLHLKAIVEVDQVADEVVHCLGALLCFREGHLRQ